MFDEFNRASPILARIALPYVARDFCALPFNKPLSLLLDRLLIISESE